jgi:hypothetical protein
MPSEYDELRAITALQDAEGGLVMTLLNLD